MSLIKNSSILKIAWFFIELVVVAMVIVINSVIGGFSWVDLVWLAASAVQLQVSDYSQLSDYNCKEWSVKNEAPITIEEFVMIMIIKEIDFVYTEILALARKVSFTKRIMAP